MSTLADPASSRALLVGAFEYEHFDALSGVENNLAALRNALVDGSLWGLPSEHCRVLTQPGSPVEVMKAMQDLGAAATDTLLVYFAGHGLIDPRDDEELYLALPATERRRFYTALPFNWVRQELRESPALRKIVILDCCYSGRALGRMGDDATDIRDLLEIEGTCVLTATASTRQALAPPDAEFTAFTGELLATLDEGVPHGPALLDMDTIYRAVRTRMRAKSLPMPQQGQLDRGGDIPLVRNRAAVEREDAPADPPELSIPVSTRPEAWRARLRLAKNVQLRIPDPPRRNTRGNVIALICLGGGWLAATGWLGAANLHSPWLAVTLLAGLMFGFAGFTRESLLGALVVFGGLGSLGGYVYGLFAAHTISLRVSVGVWLVVAFMVFGLTATIDRERQQYRQSVADHVKGEALARTLLKRSWFGTDDVIPVHSALIRPLLAIPAARFAPLPASSAFELAAVAGNQVLLIGHVQWPAGRYTLPGPGLHEIYRDGERDQFSGTLAVGFAAEVEVWQRRLPDDAAPVRAVIIVHGGWTDERPDLEFREDGPLSFVSASEFSEAAGEVLIKGQDVLDSRVLGKVAEQIEAG